MIFQGQNTALDVARAQGNSECVELLENYFVSYFYIDYLFIIHYLLSIVDCWLYLIQKNPNEFRNQQGENLAKWKELREARLRKVREEKENKDRPKWAEVERLRKENEELQITINNNNETINTLISERDHFKSENVCYFNF